MDRQWKNRLRRWAAGEGRKLRPLSWGQRAEYVWDYYKLWILGGLAAVILLTAGARQLREGSRENWFYACFANTYAEIGNGSPFWRAFARYAGYDLREKNLVFNAQVYCDPTRGSYGNQYYRFLITIMDSGTLDALVMEQDRLLALGASGRLMDLEDPRVRETGERYSDRLLYCEPLDDSYGKAMVPVGIDLTGSILDGGAYGEPVALGVNALSPHPDQAAQFLDWLFSEEADVVS